MKMFYCPKCDKLEINFKFKSLNEERELHTFSNIRDGWGMPINHIICKDCGNLLAGTVIIRSKDENGIKDEIEYFKDIITKYNKEEKDGGFIGNGKLDILLRSIKARKNL